MYVSVRDCIGHQAGSVPHASVSRPVTTRSAEEDGGGADGGGGDGGVADVAAVHGVVWRAACGCFAGGTAEEDLVDVGKDGIGADAVEGGEAEGVVGTALGREAMQVGGGLICVAGIEDGGGGEGGGSKAGR